MEQDGVVSLWIGNAASSEELDNALLVSFSEDGDFLGSPFSRALQLGYYDAGVVEVGFRENGCNRLKDLLMGASYLDQILPELERKAKLTNAVNCFVLLYNCRFEGDAAFSWKGISLTFIGTAEYDSAAGGE